MANQGSGMNEVGQLVHYIANELAALKAAQQESAVVAINSKQALDSHVLYFMNEFRILKDAMTDLNNAIAAGNRQNMGDLETLRKERDLLETEAGRQNAKYEAKVNELANIQAELMQSRLNSEQQVEESETRVKALHEAENTRKRLAEELDASHEQYRILASRYRDLELQSQTYREESIKCRNIITKKSGGCEEIDDTELLRTYRGLRSQIQDIVLDFFSEQASIPLSHELSALHNKLLDPLRTVSGSTQRIHRLRAILFKLVDEWILSKQCFALERFEEKAEKGQFEKGLGIFERKLLDLDPEQKQDINKWRAQTVIYASLLCIPQSLADETADRIYDVLKPLLPSTTSKEIEQQVLTQLNQLCKHAFEFTIRHRRTQDEYRCVSPEKGTILSESIARPQAKESCSELEGAQHDKIALVLSPALVKYPLLEEMIVLEKAHVVVYRD